MAVWHPSANRGFYYGSSKNSRWNHDQSWREYVTISMLKDARHPANLESEKHATDQLRTSKSRRLESSQLLSRGPSPSALRTGGGTGGSGGMGTGKTSWAVRQSVENLVAALSNEQEQRLKKEKLLEQLLMDETVQRIKAEQNIKQLARKIESLEESQGSSGAKAGVGSSKVLPKTKHR